ncbi:hypothetical protein J3R30DRAFT_3715244 [Lentinula aciculospora]|uniref:Carrier domain-containing protein n=1 Tax=Lentinula aciculospora TaxID=153920 RepID=A0A9W9DFL4_9AGAR|nr:hypothetical protein J3R30DRAFT_3715244 [Lentinula aciculospora]
MFFKSCDITTSRSKNVSSASRTELEVLTIFSRALGCLQESIGIEDSFFDLGGHSLTSTDPTVKAVASHVDSTRSTMNELNNQSHIAISALTETIFNTNPDSSSRIIFVFPEVVAFGDSHWGQPLDPNETIEAMAGAFVEETRKIQPEGPYFLASWSIAGGPDKNTKMVIMIDSNVYGTEHNSQGALETTILNERWIPSVRSSVDDIGQQDAVAGAIQSG